MDVISLTRSLLSFNTIYPPGNEEELAKFTGELLSRHDFQIKYIKYDQNRSHLIAWKGLSENKSPVIFSGHFDTVPLGNKIWKTDPFNEKISEGKIWGRGSSDMKGGLAAMIVASIQAFEAGKPEGGLMIIFTAGEEQGCSGVKQLMDVAENIKKASAIIVGEPTSNEPVIGHKGAIYFKAKTSGLTAHSSMPRLGINAIYKAAASVLAVRDFDFNVEPDLLLGYPTANVGQMSGGMNINSVPDHAEFTIDIRTTTKCIHQEIIEKIGKAIGEDTKLEVLVDLDPVTNDKADPFIQFVYDVCGSDKTGNKDRKTMPYLTDGSVLQKKFNSAPTVILGPGEPEMAHQTDEFCFVEKIEQAVFLYKEILLKWKGK